MSITWTETEIPLKDLKEYERNPRRIKDAQYKSLVKSLKEDGYHQRLVVNTDLTIIGGHQRKRALLDAGFRPTDKIPVLMPSIYLDKEDFQRINVRDNLPFGEFDFDMLTADFDIDQLLEWGMPEDWLPVGEEETKEGLTDDDVVPDVPKESKTRLGDLYALGNHRLMCGDSTSIDAVEYLMNGVKADMVFTDPPYGIDEKTNRTSRDSRNSLSKNQVFDKILGDTSTAVAIDAYNVCAGLDIPVMVFWGANYYCHSLPVSANWLVWDKRVEENQRDVNSDCEVAWVKSKFKSIRIFRHLWKGLMKDSERGERRIHPTQKPVELAVWSFNEYGKDSINVLDLFGGSGSTLIACEKTNRKCFMMELSPNYCDVIVKRWEDFTGKKAELINGN